MTPDYDKTNEFIENTINRIIDYGKLIETYTELKNPGAAARMRNYIKDEIEWIVHLKQYPIVKMEERQL